MPAFSGGAKHWIPGSYSYSPVWYFIAGISIILVIYGSAYVLWVFHTYYLNVDNFAGIVRYVALIDAILLADPILVFLRIKIGWWWSMPLAIVALFLTFGTFVTSFDILALASLVNILLSVPRTERIHVNIPNAQ